jgi:NAD(P)-dependent dehydrogenase (short-subunit alcohol dehydrogenase family)
VNEVRFDFTGAAVLVTGGTSGIGHAIAQGFAEAGATVTVTGTRASAADYDVDLDAVAYRQLVLTDPASVDALAASLDRLDVLVSNAGATMPAGDEWTADGFAAAVELGLVGPMRLATACADLLAQSDLTGGGSLISVASMAAYRSSAFVPGYGAAKAGVVNLTANLARRWADRGVRANAIAPGVIETPMTAPLSAIPELGDPERARIPLGRFGTPEEIVGVALFLASSAASYLTGHTVAVDGGYLTV